MTKSDMEKKADALIYLSRRLWVDIETWDEDEPSKDEMVELILNAQDMTEALNGLKHAIASTLCNYGWCDKSNWEWEDTYRAVPDLLRQKRKEKE